MRDYLINLLTDAASRDQRIELVTGDLGFGVLDKFIDNFPDRFLNAGVAEQNMMGVAAGMAFSGKKVFVYSIANFPTFRCLEQIRNDIAFHNLDVTIVSIGAGFSYGSLGYSHFALEDISVMRPLLGMKIYCPGNHDELDHAFAEIISADGPKYLRLDKGAAFIDKGTRVEDSNLVCYIERDLSDLAILTTGTLVEEAIEASQKLNDIGVLADVFSVPCLWPFSPGTILNRYRWLFVAEEHSKIGGLYSIVAEHFASAYEKTSIMSISTYDSFLKVIGSQSYLRKIHGIDAESIKTRVTGFLSGL